VQSNSHIRFLGAIVFICSLATGLALIANGQESLPSFFGGILLISYTLLQLVVGLYRNDEGEDF
tara:strand:+ start:433 stop:624 length:192 start_codon:yes stop_codon:yes gene_type:complete